MPRVRVTWDDAAVKLATQSPHGAVGRAMGRLADSAVLIMKYRAPVYHGPERIGPVLPGHPRQVARRSGTLRSSIRKYRQDDGSYLIGPTDMVGPPWAPPQFLGPLIEQGTRPHRISSHGPWPLYSTTTRTAYGHAVQHPGTRPRPFIAPTARDLNGIRIRIS